MPRLSAGPPVLKGSLGTVAVEQSGVWILAGWVLILCVGSVRAGLCPLRGAAHGVCSVVGCAGHKNLPGEWGQQIQQRDIPLSRTWCSQLWGGPWGGLRQAVNSGQVGFLLAGAPGLLEALELSWAWLRLFLIHHSAEHPLHF